MTKFEEVKSRMLNEESVWLVSGCAGFIGSHLLEALLKLGQKVIGIDNFSTGFQKNLDEVKSAVSRDQWANFDFTMGCVTDHSLLLELTKNVDYILHQAALGSVPRSIKDPLTSHHSNVTGHLSMLSAAKENSVKRMIYASSSSVYGDHPSLPKVESVTGKPLSPYALTKKINELYSDVFSRTYDVEAVGVRYFNVFGPRQNPDGPYAAVIPRWATDVLNGDEVFINGDGTTSRDFCYVDNVVQLNLLAALYDGSFAPGEVFNCALNDEVSLLELFKMIAEYLGEPEYAFTYKEFRDGDVKHSRADIFKAVTSLGYEPTHRVKEGIGVTLDWFKTKF